MSFSFRQIERGSGSYYSALWNDHEIGQVRTFQKEKHKSGELDVEWQMLPTIWSLDAKILEKHFDAIVVRDVPMPVTEGFWGSEYLYFTLPILGADKGKATLGWSPDLLNWQQPFSIKDFTQLSENLCDENDALIFTEDMGIFSEDLGDTDPAGSLQYEWAADPMDTVKKALDKGLELLEGLISEVLMELNSSDAHSFESRFSFPKEHEAACLQYLTYFAQFLEDVGIEATSDIERAENDFLFRVTPTDASQALGQIRQALDIYLRLPEAQDLMSFESSGSDVAVQQLKDVVLHLKSQVIRINSSIELKDQTIHNLSLANYELSSKVSALEQKQQDKFPAVDGLLSVTPYKGKGFEINLPELLRRLKRRFSI